MCGKVRPESGLGHHQARGHQDGADEHGAGDRDDFTDTRTECELQILESVQTSAESALAELRAVVRSILPTVLENEGLDGALSALVAQSPVPATLRVRAGRAPVSVETTVYFAVAEALTNVARHSGASHAMVVLTHTGDRLHARVEDDGHGGAVVRDGSGLAGIARRAEAHDGTLRVWSPAGGPTVVEVELPCGS